MELSSLNIRIFLIFQEELSELQKQTKNLFWRNFLSRHVFIIFAAVKHNEIVSVSFPRKFP